MRRLLVSIVLVLTFLPACAQQSSVRGSLNGAVDGDKYKNEYYGFTFKLPQGWQFAPARTKDAVLASLNVAAPDADNRILVMLVRPVPDAPLPDIIAIFSARYRRDSPNGAEEALSYFKRNRATATDTEITAPIRTVQFGGIAFAREDTHLKGQDHYMTDFALVTQGKLLSFQVHAASKERADEVAAELSDAVSFGKLPKY